MAKRADTFTFQIRPEVRSALEKQAADEDRSISNIINRYLREGLEQGGYLKPEKKAK